MPRLVDVIVGRNPSLAFLRTATDLLTLRDTVTPSLTVVVVPVGQYLDAYTDTYP